MGPTELAGAREALCQAVRDWQGKDGLRIQPLGWILSPSRRPHGPNSGRTVSKAAPAVCFPYSKGASMLLPRGGFSLPKPVLDLALAVQSCQSSTGWDCALTLVLTSEHHCMQLFFPFWVGGLLSCASQLKYVQGLLYWRHWNVVITVIGSKIVFYVKIQYDLKLS